MNVIPFFVADTKASIIEEPVERRFHNPAILSQSAAVFGIAPGDQWNDAPVAQRLSNLFLSVIGAIREHGVRSFSRTASRLGNGRDRIHQWDSHFRVVNIGAGVRNGQWYAVAVGDQVALGAVFPAIRGIGAGLCPPKSARVEQLSMAAADQSIRLARPSLLRNNCQMSCQMPARCQSRRRRQQVIPLPQPISCGNSSHWMPVRKTNRMPVRQARSGTRGRPPLGLGGSVGKSGLICFHNSSVSSGLAISVSSMTCSKHRRNHDSFNRFC